MLAFTEESARPQNAAFRAGLFGPVVDVPEGTPAFDRALGFAGRHPAWTAQARSADAATVSGRGPAHDSATSPTTPTT